MNEKYTHILTLIQIKEEIKIAKKNSENLGKKQIQGFFNEVARSPPAF